MYASEAIYSEQARWDAFVASCSTRSFLQTWLWGEVQQKMNVPHWRLVVEEKGKIVAVALVVERELKLGYSWLYIPRGPLFADSLSEEDREQAWNALEEKLQSLADERKSFFVRIDPLVESFSREGWRKSSREVQPKDTLILGLAASEEELLSSMHSKTRYNLRLAERKGVQVRFSSDVADVQEFLSASQSVTRRTGFSYHPDEYYAAIIEILGSRGMAELALASVEGKTVAAHLMIYADDMATYAHGASNHAYRSIMAPALLYWKTILRAKEKGMKEYDFFGVAPFDADDDHPWSGITRMKEGFGGKRVSYAGAYDFVVQEGLYAMFNITRKARNLVKNGLT